MNDISDSAQMFVDAINGKYANENHWITCEEFDRLHDTDIYIRIVWSF